MSDPGNGVQAQLWRASACTHGFREVSNACVYIMRMRIRLCEIFPCVTFHVIYKSECVLCLVCKLGLEQLKQLLVTHHRQQLFSLFYILQDSRCMSWRDV